MFMTHLRIGSLPKMLVRELHTAEVFVLSSLRLWALAHSRLRLNHPDWREGLRRAGIGPAGAAGFDTVCRIVATTSLQCLDIQTLHCAYLGDAEASYCTYLGSSNTIGSWTPKRS